MLNINPKSLADKDHLSTSDSTNACRVLSGRLSKEGERERARRRPSNGPAEGTWERSERFPEQCPSQRPGWPSADRSKRAGRPRDARDVQFETKPFATSKRVNGSNAVPVERQSTPFERRKRVSESERFAGLLQETKRRRWTHQMRGGAEVFPLLLLGWVGGNRSRLRAKYSTPKDGFWCANEAQSAGIQCPENSGLPARELNQEVTQMPRRCLQRPQKGHSNLFEGCCGWLAVIDATSTANGVEWGRVRREYSDRKKDKAHRAFVAQTLEGRAIELPRSSLERDFFSGGAGKQALCDGTSRWLAWGGETRC